MSRKDNQTDAANQLANPSKPASPKPAGGDSNVVRTPTGQRVELGQNRRETKATNHKTT